MTSSTKVITLAAALLVAATSFAQAPAAAPAGSTGLCKDGTYYSGDTKKGACRGHKGVKDWYGASTATAAAPKAAATAAPAIAAATAPATAATAPAAPAASKSSSKSAFTPPATAAAGGGPGMVWANESSKVYHCSTDKWYGKTKNGKYMSEGDAKAAGFHPDHGKSCQ